LIFVNHNGISFNNYAKLSGKINTGRTLIRYKQTVNILAGTVFEKDFLEKLASVNLVYGFFADSESFCRLNKFSDTCSSLPLCILLYLS